MAAGQKKQLDYQPRLKQLFKQELVPKLQSELAIDNPNRVPRLVKVVVSVGLGRAKDDKRMFEVAVNTLRKITGQQPIETKARKSIAGFKLREGQKVGLKVTLRQDRMYEFVDRLINVVLPRVRDFHGVSGKSFDEHGNYSLGFNEQSVFPELGFDDVSVPHGLEVTIVTSAKDAKESKALLSALGMPFNKEEK